IAAISSSVNASSMPLVAKSKLSASDNSDRASISSGSLSMSAHLSSASALVAAAMTLTRWVGLDVLRIAALARHLRLEISIVALGDLDVRVDNEDQLAPLRPEALASAALAGLDDDGVALQRARHGERPARAIETALVVETMNLFGDGEESGRLVLNDGVLFPAVPMAEYDLHEFVGAVVAQVVLDHLLAAHILGFAVVERGDDVPGRAALRPQIEAQ